MKIDIHVHTKKIKSGDAHTRNITEDVFDNIIRNTDVKILAITNHNHFDVHQYLIFKGRVEDVCQIWPGIELDILENGQRAHLIVIANPRYYIAFNERVQSILSGKNPDTFTISLEDMVNTFKDLDCIYIAHYFVKKPNLGDLEIEKLSGLISNPKRLLKEATNSISAGIYISHGHNSIYGSDVQDWAAYTEIAETLPELRLPVESFEQFCLLLEKDEATIDTILSRKTKEIIDINPFNSAAETLQLEIYNDINILFGSKGTGKTEILGALSQYFNQKGHKTEVYRSNDAHLNDVFDLRGNNLSFEISQSGIDNCTEEIEFIKNAIEEDVTSPSKYYNHFSIEETNKISQKLKIKNIAEDDATSLARELEDVNYLKSTFESFQSNLKHDVITDYVDPVLLDDLFDVLTKIITDLSGQTETKFLDLKASSFLNVMVRTFIKEISIKTGRPPKPTKTGFATYALNRIKIEQAVSKILKSLSSEIEPIMMSAGSLGQKGELICKTNFKLQNGAFTDGNYVPLGKNIKKTTQKEFAKAVSSIHKHIYENDLFKKISVLNEIEGVDSIQSIDELLLYFKHFTIDGSIYHPSNGESSMILLHNELTQEKEIYLIDEPEKSLGNDYISEVIVPLLKEKALMGKRVIVATHDANIAVRTLPYNSIYRLHERNLYYTMTGNPFSNTLKCVNNSRPELDWKEVSMKTLEGGRSAFGERGKIYGN
jgi:predicted ATPase